MRVLIIGLNYLPESTSIGPYTAGLAEYLRRQRHTVQVVTGFPMLPSWRVWDGYRGRLFRRELINGVPVLRTFLYVPRDPRGLIRRMLYDFSFMLSSLVGSLFTDACDVVITVSPPLQLGVTGWVVSRLKRASLIFHIQDLVPNVAVATGLLREGSIPLRLARFLARFVYRRADLITVISDGFRNDLVRESVDEAKVRVMPNYIDLSAIRPAPRNNGFRAKHGIDAKDFLIMYSGNVGLKQGLETLVDAAAILQNTQDIRFYIVGDGPSAADLKARAQRLRLKNVVFLPLQPREHLSEQLSAADALVITQRAAVTDSVFPGKILYYMAVARPILAAVDQGSETGRFISTHQIGAVSPAENPGLLAEAILRLKTCDVVVIGDRSRAVVEKLFDQTTVLPQFERLLSDSIELTAEVGRT